MDQLQISSYPVLKIVQFIFSVLGILFYFALIFLFHFYYHCIRFIKEKIFSFILVHSLTSLLVLFIENPTYNLFFKYFSNIIQLYLILYFFDKCLKLTNIPIDKNIKINYKIYIILIFMICTFPFSKYLPIFEKPFFDQNPILLILCILLFEQIRGKMEIIIEIFHENDFYYYNIYKMINNYFKASFFLFLLTISAKILDNFLIYKNILLFITYFLNLSAVYVMAIGCILFFYCLNRDDLKIKKKYKKENEENNDEKNKFRVIDVEADINQDDVDKNTDFTSHLFNEKRKSKNKSHKKKEKGNINLKQYEEYNIKNEE